MAASASRLNSTGFGLASSARLALEFSIVQLRDEAAQPVAVA
jgi:hypothetical protein